MADNDWWRFCPQKNYISEAPDFSGLDPETLEPWSPTKVVELLGIQKLTDPNETLAACKKVVEAHPQQREAYRKGKVKIIGFFIKQVMDATGNGADPRLAQETLETLLRE